MHILRQMERDPRLAWLIGPGSRTFELLIEEGAEIYGRTFADLSQRVESRLQFEPWPSNLPVEIDPQAILLAVPEPKPTSWHRTENSYSSNGHIVFRNDSGHYPHLWRGFETRKSVLGHEIWRSEFRYYVPDDFGNLVEVPGP